ncbi:MAG: Uma2 family endonuclease [Caldilineales bacterium]|nr:Uma2 family endonuclease [Caldilineales bacterium]
MATPRLASPGLAPVHQAAIEYPETDGEPLGESPIHVFATIALVDALYVYFRDHPDVYVTADLFLYYQEGNPRARVAPDVMVVKGVPKLERRVYKLWEEKVPPCTVFEIISRATWREDTVTKSALYARLGVKEYFMFDPEGDSLPEPLVCFRLEDEMYAPIPAEPDGTLPSAELGLGFRAEGHYLRAFELATGQPLPTIAEAVDRAKAEAARAEREAARAAAAEAEVARLKALLGLSE